MFKYKGARLDIKEVVGEPSPYYFALCGFPENAEVLEIMTAVGEQMLKYLPGIYTEIKGVDDKKDGARCCVQARECDKKEIRQKLEEHKAELAFEEWLLEVEEVAPQNVAQFSSPLDPETGADNSKTEQNWK